MQEWCYLVPHSDANEVGRESRMDAQSLMVNTSFSAVLTVIECKTTHLYLKKIPNCYGVRELFYKLSYQILSFALDPIMYSLIRLPFESNLFLFFPSLNCCSGFSSFRDDAYLFQLFYFFRTGHYECNAMSAQPGWAFMFFFCPCLSLFVCVSRHLFGIPNILHICHIQSFIFLMPHIAKQFRRPIRFLSTLFLLSVFHL